MTLSPMSNQWTESCEFYNFAASEAEEFYPADPKKLKNNYLEYYSFPPIQPLYEF